MAKELDAARSSNTVRFYGSSIKNGISNQRYVFSLGEYERIVGAVGRIERIEDFTEGNKLEARTYV